MLEVRELAAGWDGRAVVSGVSLRVSAGQTACIVGPSGCGKTTLLLAIAGLVPATAGCALLDGAVIRAGERKVGLILQDHGLFPWMTVRENVGIGLRLRGVPTGQRRAAVDEALAGVGLADCADRWPRQLSGGQRQRVAIARCLVLEPALLLMDEPFSSLDALAREEMQDVVLDLPARRRLACLLVTHGVEEAAVLGTSVSLLAGSPAAVVRTFENPGQGTPAHRDTAAFRSLCAAIRGGLAAARTS